MNLSRSESANIVLRENNALISLPEICVRLRDILSDPIHSRKDVADVIQYEPSLAARLLRIVNSAYYALPTKVASVSQALGIIGERELQNLVMVTSIMKNSIALDSRINISQFWQSSIFSAVLARNLHTNNSWGNKEEMFLCGLLLNIGKLPLYAKEPTLEAAVIYEMEQGDCSALNAELKLLGTDHCHVGAILAENWNFPEKLVTLIAEHHAITQDINHQALIVANIAAYFSDFLEFKNINEISEEEYLKECPCYFQGLELTRDALQDVVQQSMIQYMEVFQLFYGSTH